MTDIAFVPAYYYEADLLCRECAMDVRQGDITIRLQRIEVPVETRDCEYCHQRISV